MTACGIVGNHEDRTGAAFTAHAPHAVSVPLVPRWTVLIRLEFQAFGKKQEEEDAGAVQR